MEGGGGRGAEAAAGGGWDTEGRAEEEEERGGGGAAGLAGAGMGEGLTTWVSRRRVVVGRGLGGAGEEGGGRWAADRDLEGEVVEEEEEGGGAVERGLLAVEGGERTAVEEDEGREAEGATDTGPAEADCAAAGGRAAGQGGSYPEAREDEPVNAGRGACGGS